MTCSVTVFRSVPDNPGLFYVYRAGNKQEQEDGNHIVIDATLNESELMDRIKERNPYARVYP